MVGRMPATTTDATSQHMPPDDDDLALLTPDEVAVRIGMSRRYVLDIARRGLIGSVHMPSVGGGATRVMFTRQHLADFIASNARGGGGRDGYPT